MQRRSIAAVRLACIRVGQLAKRIGSRHACRRAVEKPAVLLRLRIFIYG
jgi:hypothetical protein